MKNSIFKFMLENRTIKKTIFSLTICLITVSCGKFKEKSFSENSIDDQLSRDVASPSSSNSPWQNPRNNFDVNNDGNVTEADAVAVTNGLRKFGMGRLPDRTLMDTQYYDVNGDGQLYPFDQVLVANEIIRRRRLMPPMVNFIVEDSRGKITESTIGSTRYLAESFDSRIKLRWTSENAVTCTIQSSVFYPSTATTTISVKLNEFNGLITNNLRERTRFDIYCRNGAGGYVQDSIYVVVSIPMMTLRISSSSLTIENGGSTQLSWSSAYASSCKVSIGDRTLATGINGTVSTGVLNVDSKVFLTCTDANHQDKYASVDIKVSPAMSFTAKNDHIPYGGTATINWDVKFARGCFMKSKSNTSSVTKFIHLNYKLTGSYVSEPLAETTEYTLTCNLDFVRKLTIFVPPQALRSLNIYTHPSIGARIYPNEIMLKVARVELIRAIYGNCFDGGPTNEDQYSWYTRCRGDFRVYYFPRNP